MIPIKTVLMYLRRNLLLVLTVSAVLLGLVLGFSLRSVNASSNTISLIGFPGEIFMRLLKLLILPLIVSSIISALVQVDSENFGRIGILTIVYYGCTTTLAIITGVLCVMLIRPGISSFTRSTIPPSDNDSISPLDTILDVIRNMFPDNLIQATFEKAKTTYTKTNVTSPLNVTTVTTNKDVEYIRGINVLGIIVISMAVGIVLSKMSKKAKPVVDIIFVVEDLIMNIVGMVMWFSPIGITSMITSNVMEMENPSETAGLMGKYLMTVLLALFIHAAITMPGLYVLWSRKNPIRVIKSMVQSLVMTFGTSSSGAALPLSLKCMEENHRVDKRVTRFILPLGCNINMDGNALYEAIAVIFIAQMNNIHVSWFQAVIISLITTLSSLGLNSLPAGLVSILVILDTVGFPTKDLPLIMTVDWLIDRTRTTINVLGDAYVTDAVATVVKNKLDNAKSVAKIEFKCDDGKSEDTSLPSTMTSSQNILQITKEHKLRGDMNCFTLTVLTILVSTTYAAYQLVDSYLPSNFASKFDFITYDDPSHGYVNYVNQSTAENLGLFKQQDGKIYMGVDHTNVASGRGRNSIRISSKNVYTHGLFILNLNHMPDNQCGTWPAFWSFGPSWPNNGEIDIIEGVHEQTSNGMTLHTNAGCSITNTHDFTGHIVSSDCNTNGNGSNGCSIKTDNTQTYGSGFNAIGGGVYATEWTSTAIRIWFFPRSAIPADITNGTPNTSNWGLPLAKFSGCSFDTHFRNHTIIINTTFCGDWAGSVWQYDGACVDKAPTCVDYVKNNPTVFKDVYWLISSLKVYQNSGSVTIDDISNPSN